MRRSVTKILSSPRIINLHWKKARIHNTFPLKSSTSRIPLWNFFKSNFLQKIKCLNRKTFIRKLDEKTLSSSKPRVKFSDGKIIRNSDIAFPLQGKWPRKGNQKKPDSKTWRELELATSDKNTRTRASNCSRKSSRRQSPCAKKATSTTGYLAYDESTCIPYTS